MNNLNKFLFILLVLILIIIPKVVFSVNGVSDSHIYSSIVPAQLSINQGKFIINPYDKNLENTLNGHTNSQSERVGLTSIQVILTEISGLNLKRLQFIPFNSLILGLLAFVISSQFLKNNFYCYAISIFLMYEPNIGFLTNTTSEHAFGYVLYFTSIVIFLTINQFKEQRLAGIPLFILVFISTLLIYYTSELYILILSSSFFSILFITSKLKKFNIYSTSYITKFQLPLILILIFLFFDNVIFEYLGRSGLLTDLGNGISSYILNYFTHIIKSLLGQSPQIIQQSTFLEGTSNILIVWGGYLLYLSLLIPIIIYIFQFSLEFIKVRDTSITLQTLFFISIIITGIIDIMIYLFIGLMSFKYILLAFPFLAFYSIDKIFKHINLKKIVVVIILILCIAKFSIYLYTNQFQDRSYTITDPSSKWFTNIVTSDTRILVDLDIGGKILTEAAYNKVNISVYGFRDFGKDENVMFLYSNNISNVNKLFQFNKYDFLVLSMKDITNPFNGLAWRNFPPIGENIDYINNYIIFNKIYQDNNVFIYKYKNIMS